MSESTYSYSFRDGESGAKKPSKKPDPKKLRRLGVIGAIAVLAVILFYKADGRLSEKL